MTLAEHRWTARGLEAARRDGRAISNLARTKTFTGYSIRRDVLRLYPADGVAIDFPITEANEVAAASAVQAAGLPAARGVPALARVTAAPEAIARIEAFGLLRLADADRKAGIAAVDPNGARVPAVAMLKPSWWRRLVTAWKRRAKDAGRGHLAPPEASGYVDSRKWTGRHGA